MHAYMLVLEAPTFAFITVSHGDAQGDGFLHVAELDSYITSLETELSVGQRLDVRVLAVDARRGEMLLSARGRPRRQFERLKELGSEAWLKGRVVRVMPFGAFVEVLGVEGLLHRSEMEAVWVAFEEVFAARGRCRRGRPSQCGSPAWSRSGRS